MKYLILLLATLPIINSAIVNHWEKGLEEDFFRWKMLFNKSYANYDEEESRRSVWKMNIQQIMKHNLEHDWGMHSYRLEMNHFGDLNGTEFQNIMNGFDNKRRMQRNDAFINTMYLPPLNVEKSRLPNSVDWREHGYVTPVKNQGHCGSCWAFSSTGALEGQHFRKTGKLVSLSEQNLIDCSRGEGNEGCEGGLMDQAFQYVKQQHGIDDENDYSYIGQDGSCHYTPDHRAATDTGFVNIPQGNEKALKTAVAHVGPISVAIDASHRSLQFYSSGVYDEPNCSSTQLDHGVLVVGYGTQDGQDYWIVKNSWGPVWGAKGYILMSRNKDNQCGIATSASFPTV